MNVLSDQELDNSTEPGLLEGVNRGIVDIITAYRCCNGIIVIFLTDFTGCCRPANGLMHALKDAEVVVAEMEHRVTHVS